MTVDDIVKSISVDKQIEAVLHARAECMGKSAKVNLTYEVGISVDGVEDRILVVRYPNERAVEAFLNACIEDLERKLVDLKKEKAVNP